MALRPGAQARVSLAWLTNCPYPAALNLGNTARLGAMRNEPEIRGRPGHRRTTLSDRAAIRLHVDPALPAAPGVGQSTNRREADRTALGSRYGPLTTDLGKQFIATQTDLVA